MISKSFKIVRGQDLNVFSLFRKRLILFYIYNGAIVVSAGMMNVKLQIAASSYLLNISLYKPLQRFQKNIAIGSSIIFLRKTFFSVLSAWLSILKATVTS